MQTYQGPDTYGLDISGLRALIKAGAFEQTRELPKVETVKPLLRKGKRRKPSGEGRFWTILTVGLSFAFVSIVGLATIGVYSWLRAHGG